jgi:peptide/nickel transport system permease protein
MAIVPGVETTIITPGPSRRAGSMGRFNRWDTPWFNPKLIVGVTMIALIVLLGLLGRVFWDENLAFVGSGPLSQPPVGVANLRGEVGTWDHPLGTENAGRDMLALMIIGAPNSLWVGLVAATIGMVVGIILGFTAGFVGGKVDDVIRLISDVTITIPALLVLIVIQSVVREISLTDMALLISLFTWPGPTRLIRAQVLSMKQSGYVLMARLSGTPTRRIMFLEMMPNLLPYLAASFIGTAAGAIIAAIGLEVLGLGPQRVPTLGVTIFFALESAAILREMRWWWGLPTAILAFIFGGLLLINLGLDEVANPRLRQASE